MALQFGAGGRLLHLLVPLPTAGNTAASPHPTRTSLLNRTNTNLLFVFFDSMRSLSARASKKEEAETPEPKNSLLDDEFIRRISGAGDANEALNLISERHGEGAGDMVDASDCCAILAAAIQRNNVELAVSIFSAMRRSTDPTVIRSKEMHDVISGVPSWRWPRPDVRIYACMVQGLAASMRVSDAILTISDVSRVGIVSGEEVPFGKVVRCPRCMIAIAVAQPQHGVQIASCSKCRYQYELFSGDIVSIKSEVISTDIPAWERALRFLKILRNSIPAAVHSVVLFDFDTMFDNGLTPSYKLNFLFDIAFSPPVQAPTGTSRTQRFATQTTELPAQERERVTIALSKSSYSGSDRGSFRISSGIPGYGTGEPLSLVNHATGLESQLVKAPEKSKGSFLLDPPILFSLLLLATGDAASGIIDPALPRLISLAVGGSLLLGTTVNLVVLPQLRKLPQKTVDAVAIKQQLLSQYDLLQARIAELTQAAEKEVWMLARMCQLEDKIVAVGEASYRARRTRVKRVRESLENSLMSKIELIDSYARISSMIEIEVEMESDVLAAEAVNSTDNFAEQIGRLMELENLEQRWREQAEANDELERLLNSQPLSPELV